MAFICRVTRGGILTGWAFERRGALQFMRFVDRALAERLEMTTARSGRECADVCAEIAGGIATFSGTDSPITQAFGVGLSGPVSENDLDRLEDFFFSRGAPVALELCPFIDPSLLEVLKSRPYRLEEFSNVLVREVSSLEEIPVPECGLEVRAAVPRENTVYSEIVAEAFSEYLPINETLRRVIETFFKRPSGRCFLAIDGNEIVSGGCVAADQNVAEFYGAATLKSFRNRGAQTRLISARLKWAVEQGCDLATTTTQPGSSSQRNYERAGFRVVYTRAKVVRNKS
jgi:GNAT superfamily N-acetyltransferase